MADLIEIRNVTKTYQLGETTVNALRGVTFSVQSGGIVALMGPSGSGKSTLLNLMGALDYPSTGEVLVNGKDVVNMEKKQTSRF